MSIIHTTKMAVPYGAGNLVLDWKAFALDPRNQRNINNLASSLEEGIRIRLPDYFFGGMLRGYEAEIRQDAILMLLGRYLAGNRNLAWHTTAGNLVGMENELQRSIAASIRFSKLRLKRRLAIGQNRSEELTEENGGFYDHPASRKGFFALPYHAQLQLCIAALRVALSSKSVSPASAKVAMLMIEEGLSEAGAARALGKSPSAINQLLKKVRKHLPRIIKSMEFPLS